MESPSAGNYPYRYINFDTKERDLSRFRLAREERLEMQLVRKKRVTQAQEKLKIKGETKLTLALLRHPAWQILGPRNH